MSLYQKQRLLLRQRTKEKDDQLHQLSRDKEELRSKLASLDSLVQHLLAERDGTDVAISGKEELSDIFLFFCEIIINKMLIHR